jgi:tetratricopeptide (TPR) repeat protein
MPYKCLFNKIKYFGLSGVFAALSICSITSVVIGGQSEEVLAQEVEPPKTATFFWFRALDLKKIGDYAGVIENSSKAIQLDPKHLGSYSSRAEARQILGDLRGALSDYDQLINISPTHLLPVAYVLRAEIRYKMRDHSGSISDCNTALKLGYESDTAYIIRGMNFYVLGDYANALSDYNKAIKINPESASAYLDRGLIKRDLTDYKGAVEDFQQAAFLSNKYPDPELYRKAIHQINRLN